MRRSRYALVRAFETRSYRVARANYLRRLDHVPSPPLVVFSMGKTGTTAVVDALERAGHDQVMKVHNLAIVSVLEANELRYRAQPGPGRPFHIWDALWLREHRPAPGRPWRVVTIVRDPIRLALATFFQTGDRLGAIDAESTVSSVESAIRSQWDELPLDWFDWQFRGELGIDVYEHSFDPARGYGIIEAEDCRVLCLRQEDLAVTVPAALHLLVGDERPIELRRANVGAEKPYADLYRACTTQLRPPPEVLDRAYSSRLVRHFYSSDEIDGFRRFWATPEHRPCGSSEK
jgi:hypothetical protein